ncbi:GIY-YIG nuclease family protein [Sandaracinus amylolyticus]|uniref:GIY-YIG nuclease family protein n=1 Tax=Sandaracinus amylolyticus TaxID=927083 RepID=UPI001F47919E|nr:GIY-YIG nuclease family protein [Sandaracinus amylolyticus]UJR81473.1 Hypothetical protein I5071_35320 [Sandaracinus amylolyticus]
MIYFVRAVGTPYVKVGFASEDVAARVATLQCGCPHLLAILGVIDGDMTAEAELHRVLGHRRVRGEWFAIEGESLPALLDEIDAARRGRAAWNASDARGPAFLGERIAHRVGALRDELQKLRDVVSSMGIDTGHEGRIDAAIEALR